MSTSSRPPIPEAYYLPPTPYVPNSPFPVLIYRSVLGTSPTPASIKEQLEPNHWLRGGQWKTYRAAHFHSVTHECYAVFQGRSTLRLGRSPLDDDTNGIGVDVVMEAGDVIVLPAGVSHHSIDSEDDYEYVGLYPDGSPKWDNNFCKDSPDVTAEKRCNARKVPVPDYDPVYGKLGHLPKLWSDAQSSKATSYDE